MPEIARLNLTGPAYDPMKGRDQESMSDKIRKNSQAVMAQALAAYQIQGARHKEEQYQVMQRTDEFLAHNGKDFFNNRADVTNPDTWAFTDPNKRADMLSKWKSQVGGNYAGFSKAYEMAKQNEMDSMAKNMLRGRAGYRTDKEFARNFAGDFDKLTDKQKTTVMENVSPDVYTQLMTIYTKGGGGAQGSDEVEGIFGFHLENDIADMLVENFDIEREDVTGWMKAETFIPEHWRDGYRAARNQDLSEFSDDEDWNYKQHWAQIPALAAEAFIIGKGGMKLWSKVFKGSVDDVVKEGSKGKGGAGKGGTSAEIKAKAMGKSEIKTAQGQIDAYKDEIKISDFSKHGKSKWFKAKAPDPKQYDDVGKWAKDFKDWKVANGLPKNVPAKIDPTKTTAGKKIEKKKAEAKKTETKPPKDPKGGGGSQSGGGQPGGTPVANESAATLNLGGASKVLPKSQISAAEKEIASKLSSGNIDAGEAKAMRDALKKVAESGDEITDAALKKQLLKAGKQSKGLLNRIARGSLKFAVIPMAATSAGAFAFQGVGSALGGDTAGEVAGVVGGSASGIAAYGATDLLKRAYNKHGSAWIMKKIVSKGGPALAARMAAKGLLGGASGMMSGGLGMALFAGFMATDIHSIYQILQQAEDAGEL